MKTVKLPMRRSWILWVTLLLCAVVNAQNSNRCKTPLGEDGVCQRYQDCPKLNNIAMKPDKSCEEYKHLWDSRCPEKSDFFCCPEPECYTPLGDDGVCKRIQDCNILNKFATQPDKSCEVYQHLWDSRCPEKSDLFCCPEPECYTPDGIPGQYANIGDCLELRGGSQDINFALNSQSMIGYFVVCCGLWPRPAIVRGNCINMNTAFPPDIETLCCGIEATAGNKIIEQPWLAILNYQNQKRLCAGSLISSKYVLTAAHCTITVPISVTLGEYNRNTTTDCIYDKDCAEDPVTIKIEYILNHHKYDPTDRAYRNDISLIRLEKSVPYTDFIRPICLPLGEPEDVGTSTNPKLTTAGWGMSDSMAASDVKFKVDLPLVDLAVCTASLDLPLYRQICAGGVKNNDSCSGDSGGPLMYKTKGQNHIVGILNFGSKTCGDGQPSVYTRVSRYNAWIYRKIRP
ncbi:unnamed protein product [Chilo suppressalis]|uniref:CLIP domain-containing serine protease n=1 Tax=Chilo suppressalis TaxID=168631 RepID=A0ABN8L4Z3_CHISP|nr:unnamed protein product [Chilo suppressalis]